MDRWFSATDSRSGPVLRLPTIPASLIGLVLIGALACFSDVARAGWREDIGLTQLQQRLGKAMPTGGGMGVSQVEMCVDENDYIPDRRNKDLLGRSINVRSGDGGFSTHATIVAQHYFGVGSSPARDIRSADIYEANAWINCMLRVGSMQEPVLESDRVQNHSWVGSLGSVGMDTDALRRTDLMIERDGVLVTAGLNNGSNTSLPPLMCSAYNVLAVGLSNANASRGPTPIDGCGRIKPDLVAPLSATSWATPVVAASGALLLEACESQHALSQLAPRRQRAARVLLVKALLMGGATKTEWPDWRKGFAAPCTDGSVPLDYRYGAGELNIDNSFRILSSGQCRAGEPGNVPITGWDWTEIPAAGVRRYYFEVPRDARAGQVSILAVWNRQVLAAPGSSPLKLMSALPDIDLRLLAVEGSTPVGLIDASTSRVDNVEHIYLKDLAPGRYAIEISSDQAAEYCLTWDAALRSGFQAHDSGRADPVPTRLTAGLAVAP
jgi:hypothetical protein